MEAIKKISRSTFTKEEDKLIIYFVQLYGQDCKRISLLMMNRNPRQVKDRYNYYLDPSINRNSWTLEEDNKLIELVSKYGTRWKTISENFNGRNEINVKNRWKYTLSKQIFLSNTKLENNLNFIDSKEDDNSLTNLSDNELKSQNNLDLLDSLALEEEKFQQKNCDIFPFYRDENIELSLFSI
jgi:hypothetical protein